MQKTVIIHILIFVLFPLFFSCKENRKKESATRVISEWTGKTIRFPENVPCHAFGKDAISELCRYGFEKAFKILLYVDSTGCTDCRLKLSSWKRLIAEVDSLFPNKVSFLFFLQLKNRKELDYLFLRDQFDHPVFLDSENKINALNHFPDKPEYQCFLLDKDNKVLMLGNPVFNRKIWELYKQTISGEKQEAKPEELTTAQPDKTLHDYGTVQKGSARKAVFTITNTGSFPLIIHQVSASCGCSNVNWDKQPVEPGGTATVSAEMTPEETGRFSKTIDVHCNVAETPLKLTLAGTAK